MNFAQKETTLQFMPLSQLQATLYFGWTALLLDCVMKLQYDYLIDNLEVGLHPIRRDAVGCVTMIVPH